MHPRVSAAPLLRSDLGDGLVTLWSTKEDKDNVADCLADAVRSAETRPDYSLMDQTRFKLALDPKHPAATLLAPHMGHTHPITSTRAP
ncbi:hypothetical protein BGZ92_011752 [Podila epicladia]|nr:hypothetical protein BGZ92_011752 [Podila epicladia]